jgi:hypothetical protein
MRFELFEKIAGASATAFETKRTYFPLNAEPFNGARIALSDGHGSVVILLCFRNRLLEYGVQIC